jgi:hypothetical protein
MKERQTHLPGDFQALRYFDALNSGDLEAVAALWEEATDDPSLERMLTEIDEGMFQEIGGKPGALSQRLARPRRRWAVWTGAAGTLAAACFLAILAWPRSDSDNHGPTPRINDSGTVIAHQSPDRPHDFSPLLQARRNLDESALPGFVWPLENVLSASTPLDRLD